MRKVKITVPWDPDDALLEKINRLEELLMTLNEAVTALAAKVSEQGTVIESAITLLGGLSAQLTAAQGNPAAVQAILEQVTLSTTALAGAVTTNTPPAP